MEALLFKVNLAVGVAAMVLMFTVKGPRWRVRVEMAELVVLLLSLGCLSVSIALRTRLAGRLPFESGPAVMLSLAWVAMLAGVLFRRRNALALPFGFVASGCALLVAHLGTASEVSPIPPVLASPLLSLHVSVIMVAYVLLAFTAFNAVVALCSRDVEAMRHARVGSLACLRPALLLLGTGIGIGAVWANISWGGYWSWDPKEVWALVTFLTYALVLHRRELSPRGFHILVAVAFITVLVTYFGINLFFGGMHAY